MKTEELQRTSVSQDPYEVSRSLQEATPLWCDIVDRHGRPVPLSSAGYVLRGGTSYRLRLVSPYTDEDVHEVRIISPPSFIETEPEVREVDEHGRLVRRLSFRVNRQFSQLLRLGIGVPCDDLEIVHLFKPGVHREAQAYLLPVVVRPLFISFIAAVVISLACYLIPKIATELFFGEQSAQFFIEAFRSPEKWLWMGVGTAAAWIGVNIINVLLLYRRSRELRTSFRAKYPAL